MPPLRRIHFVSTPCINLKMLLEIIGACDYGSLILQAKVGLCVRAFQTDPLKCHCELFHSLVFRDAFYWQPSGGNALRR